MVVAGEAVGVGDGFGDVFGHQAKLAGGSEDLATAEYLFAAARMALDAGVGINT